MYSVDIKGSVGCKVLLDTITNARQNMSTVPCPVFKGTGINTKYVCIY